MAAAGQMGQGMSNRSTYADDNNLGYNHDSIKIGGNSYKEEDHTG